MDPHETSAELSALRELCRELQETVRGLQSDLEQERRRNAEAFDHTARLELRLQEKQARIDQLMAEKKRFGDWVVG